MRFENPDVDHDVNVSKEHPLKEFSQLLLGVLAMIVLVAITLSLSAGYLAKKIPFSYEETLVQHIEALSLKPSAQQQSLQALADKLSAQMDLPEGMQITVHYSEDDTVNAFATVGGHVFFYQGLIERMPSENALAMVMAHEIAHIKHRHPISAMGRGLTMMMLAGFVAGASGSQAGEFLFNESLVLGLLKFSRDQESQADLTALRVLNTVYGNVQGAQELFDVFSEFSGDSHHHPEIFQTHPKTHHRWQELRDYAQAQGWQITGSVEPLEPALH